MQWPAEGYAVWKQNGYFEWRFSSSKCLHKPCTVAEYQGKKKKILLLPEQVTISESSEREVL